MEKNLRYYINLINKVLDEEKLLREPQELYRPIEYTMRLGGKRIRPTLLYITNTMMGGEEETVRGAAIGIEMFHNFTLLHDDLMDKSPLRRGQPTVYRKWDENTAVLSGDTMFAMSMEYFLKQETPRLQEVLKCFTKTAIEVCEGQQLDMNFEQREDVSISEYMEMIRLKTSVLLAGAMKIGAIYAGANEEDTEALYNCGIHLGLAFQLQDDLLDSYGDTAVFGKKTGQDIVDSKKTFLPLKTIEIATKEDTNRLKEIYRDNGMNDEEKVQKVVEIYNRNKIREHTEKEIEKEYEQSLYYLENVKAEETKKNPLKEVLQSLRVRKK